MAEKFFGDTAGALVGTVESLYPGSIVTVQANATDVKNLILIGCSRVQTADFQMLKSIGGDYAINTFGAGPVQMTLQGLQPARESPCTTIAGSTEYIKKATEKSIEAWYAEINIGAPNPVALSIGVNGLAFTGYAYNMVANPQSAAKGSFNYTVQIIAYPYASQKGNGKTGGSGSASGTNNVPVVMNYQPRGATSGYSV